MEKHLSAQTHRLTHTRPPNGHEGSALELSTGGQEPRLPVPAHRENLVFNRNSSIKTKVEKKIKKLWEDKQYSFGHHSRGDLPHYHNSQQSKAEEFLLSPI